MRTAAIELTRRAVDSSRAPRKPVIRIGVLTPYAAIGPEEEFSAMAPGGLVTRVLRVADRSVTVGPEGDPPTTPLGLRALTAAPLLGEAAETLAGESVDVVGHASTTSGYVIGFDEATAMASRLSALLDVPVATTCASAVLALRVLDVERVTLIGAPWFDSERKHAPSCTAPVHPSTCIERARGRTGCRFESSERLTRELST